MFPCSGTTIIFWEATVDVQEISSIKRIELVPVPGEPVAITTELTKLILTYTLLKADKSTV